MIYQRSLFRKGLSLVEANLINMLFSRIFQKVSSILSFYHLKRRFDLWLIYGLILLSNLSLLLSRIVKLAINNLRLLLIILDLKMWRIDCLFLLIYWRNVSFIPFIKLLTIFIPRNLSFLFILIFVSFLNFSFYSNLFLNCILHYFCIL